MSTYIAHHRAEYCATHIEPNLEKGCMPKFVNVYIYIYIYIYYIYIYIYIYIHVHTYIHTQAPASIFAASGWRSKRNVSHRKN